MQSRKKKNKRKYKTKGTNNDVPELLRGVEFSVVRNGHDLYLKLWKSWKCTHALCTRMEQTYKKVLSSTEDFHSPHPNYSKWKAEDRIQQ